MSLPDDPDNATTGRAALSICESLLIALNDLKIIDDKETRALLEDAAATHRNAIPVSPKPDEHRAVVTLIERIIRSGTWVRHL